MVGTITGLEQVGVVDSFPLVAGKWRARCRRGQQHRRGKGGHSRCGRNHHLHRFGLDLVLFQSHGHEATSASCPGDLADGEREAFSHGSRSRDDDHLVRLESCTHTPYLARHCRRKLVSSLPSGIPTVVVYRQIGAQATNSMVTQDIDKDLRCPKGVTPTSYV